MTDCSLVRQCLLTSLTDASSLMLCLEQLHWVFIFTVDVIVVVVVLLVVMLTAELVVGNCL